MYCDWPRLGRCCFCMPLRRGVLTCAYIHIFFSAFMLGLYCYGVHHQILTEFLYMARSLGMMPAEVCLVFYCFEITFDAILIYGAHKKIFKYVKTYYYYAILTCLALLIVEIVDFADTRGPAIIEKCILAFAGLSIQLYLLTLIRSLLQDMETSGPHTYENQLHPIANGDLTPDSNRIYNNTTVVPLDS